MLALQRKAGEKVYLFVGDVVVDVTVALIDGGKVRLAFDAPPEVEIAREEVLSDAQRARVEGRKS